MFSVVVAVMYAFVFVISIIFCYCITCLLLLFCVYCIVHVFIAVIFLENKFRRGKSRLSKVERAELKQLVKNNWTLVVETQSISTPILLLAQVALVSSQLAMYSAGF